MFGACLADGGYSTGEAARASAVSAVAAAKQVAAAAIAIDNANQLVDNYKKQRDISKRSLAISREVQDQLANVFWPREEQFLAEFSTPEPIEDIEVMGRRYAGRLSSSVAGAFAKQLREARCSFRRYCSSANRKLMQDLLLARANAMASAKVLGRNIAYAEYQARYDLNLSRRMQAVSMGRNLINQAMSLYAAAGKGMANAGAVLGRDLGTAIGNFNAAGAERRDASGYRDMMAAEAEYQEANRVSSARMPGTTDMNTLGAANPLGFGFKTSQTQAFDPEASNVMGQGDTMRSTEPNQFPDAQQEKRNDARVGNNDLARTGIYTFPVVGAGAGVVMVDMDRFPLRYVDHLNERQPYGFSF